MSYQNLSKVTGKINCLMELTGWDILGIPVKAPLSKYPVVYTLPMLTISPKKVE
jgi:leucyl-tRNA synthetase